MAVPPWSEMSLPLLKLAADGQEHRIGDAVDEIADRLNIPAEDREVVLPSGQQTRLANRLYWACTYLKKAGLLEAPRRGRFQITDEGRSILKNPPSAIDRQWLMANFQSVQDFVTHSNGSSGGDTDGDQRDETPEETLEQAYQQVREGLTEELLTQIKALSPSAFEHLVVELLVKMGYGGTRRDAGQAVGKSGDGGIDGIIKEDRLGLDTIYIQAKRYSDQQVSRPDIQGFVGAIQGRRARKGIFITTSTFSGPAKEYAGNIDPKIVLIDGPQIAEYMIDFNVGVTTANTFEVKRLDSDYFNS